MLTIINTENGGVRLQTDNVPILTKLRDAGWTGNTSNVFYIPLEAIVIPPSADQNLTSGTFYITDNGGGSARVEIGASYNIGLDDIEFTDSTIFNDA